MSRRIGLSGGLSPGPLLALVVAETLARGRRAGLAVAAAPLLTDGPIIVAAVLLMGRIESSEPALGIVNLAGGALGADEHQLAAIGGELANEIHRIVVHRQGLFEIDDVNLVAVTEDERAHLRIPVTGLVPEVYACLEHLAHGNVAHGLLRNVGLSLHVP